MREDSQLAKIENNLEEPLLHVIDWLIEWMKYLPVCSM